MDDFTRLVYDSFQRAARDREEYTLPWLNLDVDAYRAYREGRSPDLPAPFCHDPAMRLILGGAKGLDVLCLAGGGGQQSAVYSLLGARVTVLDLMEEQLQGDRLAAQHYGYPVTAIQGDMRDLSALADRSFDRVYQPISTLYVPDLRPVYREVRRVLRLGGLYYADYCWPFLMMAQNLGWDGGAYTLRISQPYRRGAIRETPDGRYLYDGPGVSEGKPIGEYHHLLSDIFNGLIEAGLPIRGVWESPRPDVPQDLQPLPAQVPAQEARYIPFGIVIIAG